MHKINNSTFIVLDGNSLFYRAFYAYPPTLTTSDGNPINAVYGFLSMLFKTIETYKPEYLAICFDFDRITFRKAKSQHYKSNRKEYDKALFSQFDTLHEVVNKFNIPVYREKGYEADDFLGTISKSFKDKKFLNGKVDRLLLITGDKDLMQCVGDNVEMIYITGTFSQQHRITEDTFISKYGFKSEYFNHYLAICGDSSDNIPGVKGIGKVGALKLVQQFGHLDNMYKNIDKVKEVSVRYSEQLIESEQEAYESLFLTSLKTDLIINYDLEPYKFINMDLNTVYQGMEVLGFKSLITTFQKIMKLYSIDFDTSFGNKNNIDISKYSKVDISKLLSDGNEEIYVYYDVKANTKSLFTQRSSIKILSNNMITDIDISDFRNLPKEKRIFIYDLKQFQNTFNIEIWNTLNLMDLMLLAYLHNSSRKNYEFKTVVEEILGYSFIDKDSWDNKEYSYIEYYFSLLQKIKEHYEGKDWEKNISDEINSNWENVKKTYQLNNIQYEESNYVNELLCSNIETPITTVLKSMSKKGVCIDVNELKKSEISLEKEIEVIKDEIYLTVGHEFNVSSPKQVAQLLYDEIGIPRKKRSTDVNVLNEIKMFHPVIPLILKYREKSKLYNTYVKGFLKYIQRNEKTFTIHTDFLQTSVVTGRISSVNPNMQNLPIKSEEGMLFRQVFIPRSGYKLISFDYSQIDLRVLAHMSKDKLIVESFIQDKDIHTATASILFNKDSKEVTKLERKTAKTINFGVIYGLSAYGLSRSLGIEVESAAEYIDNYFNMYDGLKFYLNDTIETAKENGYVETLLGRRRYIPFIKSNNKKIQSAAIREAINMPSQGTSADIMKIAMILVYNTICEKYSTSAQLLLQIHDELIVEIKEDMVDVISKEISEKMTNALKLNVPLKIDIEEWNK